MNFNINVQAHARFRVIVGKGGKTTKETEWFDNEVLNAGLARMSAGKWIDRCCVGTGNSTPNASQVALDSFLASTTAISATDVTGVQVTTEPFYLWARRTYRFAVGVASGNLSEVGLGWGDANLWNRALMRDISGNPTTITVLSDEYLDVLSEVRVYPQRTVSGSFNLVDKNGENISSHTFVGYPVLTGVVGVFEKITLVGGSIGSQVSSSGITSTPSEQEVLQSAIQTSDPAVYTNTSCEQKFLLAPTVANHEHKSLFLAVRGLMSNDGYRWGYKFQITPSIIKNSEQQMTYTFRFNWGRYESA